MSQENSSGEDKVAQEAEANIAVTFVFDEKTNILKAELSKTTAPSDCSLSALQESLQQQGYLSFQYKPAAIETLAQRAARGETGSFDIAERKEYTSVEFSFDEDSNKLSANFSVSFEDKKVNFNKLQEILKEQGFDSLTFHPGALQKVVSKLAKNERQDFEVAVRNVFSEVSFRFDEKANHLQAILTNTFTDPQISLESMREEINAKGYENLFYPENSLEALLPRIEKGEEGDIVIAEKRDAEVIVEFSADKMLALITTKPAFDGLQMSVALVKQAVIKSGVDLKLCDRVVLLDVSKQESVSKIQFAAGVTPVDGEDSRFEALIDEVKEKDRTVDDEEIVNHLDVNDFVIVDPGTPLMRRVTATTGVNGCNALGEVIHANSGEDIEFDKDLNGAVVDANNSNLLVAECKGHPVIGRKSVKVDPVLKLANVDLKSGNINFDGSIHVEGEVMAGFTVEVTGDVTVKGMIENATVIAGRNITVGGGVIGSDPSAEQSSKTENPKESKQKEKKRKEKKTGSGDQPRQSANEQLKTCLQAGGSIEVGFMSMVNAKAGENIIAKEYVIHSHLDSGNQILLGQDGGKGRLIGGDCFAAEGVLANEYGTDANVKTLVSAGTAESLGEELRVLTESLDENTNQVLSLSKVIKKMRSDTGTDRPAAIQARIDVIVNTVDTLRELITAQAQETDKITQQIEESSNIIVASKKQIYPNVEFCINGANHKFDQITDPGIYHAQDNKVVIVKSATEE